jgi:hypothetical protein
VSGSVHFSQYGVDWCHRRRPVAELELARRHGFRVAMTASTPERLAAIERSGVTAIDRRRFPDLAFDTDLADDDAVDPFDAIQHLVDDSAAGLVTSYFPLFQVNSR